MKKASHKGPHTVGLYVYETFIAGKSGEKTLPFCRKKEEKRTEGVMHKWHRVLLYGDWNIWKLIMVMDIPLWEPIMDIEFY